MQPQPSLTLPLTRKKLSRGALALWSAVIFILTILAYLPALQGDFLWDDDDHVTQNIHLRDATGLKNIWVGIYTAWHDRDQAADVEVRRQFTPQYYPLVFTSFWIEYQLFGPNPLPYHITNILLHAWGATLLWMMLRRLNVPGSWIVAAVFALHPIHVESVAWITERKNTLSSLFYFLAMISYLRFSPLNSDDVPPATRDWRWYFPALLVFIAALLSKTVTCSLPAAILVLTWWKRGRITWRDIAPTLPMFIIGLAAGVMTAWFEKTFIWAGQSDYTFNLLERFLIAGGVAWFYAYTLIWPVNLAFIYARWHIDAAQWWQYAFPLGAAAVIIALWALRKRIGRGPLVAVLLFGGTLFPALGFFDVYPFQFSFVADHFQHLASIPLSALIVAAAVMVFRKLELPEWPNGAIGVSALMLLLGFQSFRQCFIYHDLATLWSDTLAKTPDSWMPHNNLGELLRLYNTPQSLDLAAVHFRKAIELHRNDPKLVTNLGNVLLGQGRTDLAIEQYQQSLRIRPTADAQMNLGWAMYLQGKAQESLEHYREALRIDRSRVPTLVAFSEGLLGQHKVDDALVNLDLALEFAPQSAEARALRERALEMQNRSPDHH